MANRTQTAERIIRDAYGTPRTSAVRRTIRYELLGGSVALVVLRDDRGGRTCVRAARRLADGRAVQMRKWARDGFATIPALLAYFDAMYAQFGMPND